MQHTDDQLRQNIETEILNDPRLSSQAIGVAVVQGVATLTGTVQSYRRKLTAHEIAEATPFVQDVINEIAVVPAPALPDARTLSHVRAAINASADVTEDTVQIDVSDGTVTLTGNVGSHWERIVAEDIAKSVRGVKQVNNLLNVDLDEKIADEELCNILKACLGRDAALSGTNIQVSVTNRIATLSGKVEKAWKRRRAEDTIHRFGVLHVKNELVVAPVGS